MSRDDPQFFQLDDVGWGPVVGLAGLQHCSGRALSANAETGQITVMIKAPSGWSATNSAELGLLEIFVLEGDLTAGASTVGTGGFLAVPKGSEPVELSSVAGFQAIAFWSPQIARHSYYGGAIQVTRMWDIPWTGTEFPGEIEDSSRLHGVLSKSLRWPDPIVDGVHGGPNGLLRIVSMAPGFVGDLRAECHPGCWEEIIWLEGDFLMPGIGRPVSGSYLGNPADHAHGPLFSQRGAVLLVHTDAPAGFCFHDPPVSDGLVQDYLDGRSLLAEPVHTPWEECPESHGF